MTYNAWYAYSSASQSYIDAVADLSKLNQQNPFPSEANKTQLSSTLVQEQSAADNLIKSLQTYRIPSFKDLEKAKPQNRPQLFQDALSSQVTAIKAAASSKGVALPLGFYFGLEAYEKSPPSQEEVVGLSKQLSALNWIAEKLANSEGLDLKEFARVLPSSIEKYNEPAKKTAPANSEKTTAIYESLGSMRTTFICDQPSLYKLVNEISSAPYFLIIESIQVQNSLLEPPRRTSSSPQAAQAPTSPDGQNQVQRLPIIVGRELINVSMKIRFLEFAAPQQQPQQPKPLVK